MKKLTAILLALFLLLSLAACAKGESPAPEPTAVSTAAPTPEPTTEPTPEPTQEPTPEPKTTLAIHEIAEAAYKGTLSGDSYSGTYDEGAYRIDPEISPAEITVTIQDGQVGLYCVAKASAAGAVFGVETPRSPEYTTTVSGTLPLSQTDEATVRAEGDLTCSEDDLWIYWDKNKKFDRWEIQTDDDVYHCAVSIALSDGVPTAEIVVDGTASHRTATIPLRLAAPGEQPTETDG